MRNFSPRSRYLTYVSVLLYLATTPETVTIVSAAPFQNLGFESPVEGSIGNAEIPFWAANAPVSPPEFGGCLAAGCIGIYDDSSLIGLPTVSGSQTLLLQPPISDPLDPSVRLPAIVSQIGDIPSNTTHITLWARIFPTFIPDVPEEEDVVGVSINTADVELTVVDMNGEITVLGGDLSMFAGQTVELEISAGTDLEELFIAIDDVSFIPEPAPLSMLAFSFSTLLLVIRRPS